jgi:hypothetical protein
MALLLKPSVMRCKYMPCDEDKIGQPSAVILDDIAAVVDWILDHSA